MRILYVSNSSSIGGAPAALLNLVRYLSARHEIGVVLPDPDGPLNKELEALGVRCWTSVKYRITVWPGLMNPIKYMKRLYDLLFGKRKVSQYIAEIIDEFRPDVVHTNVGPLDYAFQVCKERGIPHVWHLREIQNNMTFFPSRKAFMQLIHDSANSPVAITECVADCWQLGPDAKVVYDGVLDGASLRQPDFTSSKKKCFLYVGRIEPSKGLGELLKAFNVFQASHKDYRLEIVGRPIGLYSWKCRMYVKMNGLGNAVSFEGQRKDVNAYMRNAAAVIVPSRGEGFGFVPVEAMACGTAVIVNDDAGLKEQMDRGMYLTGKEIGLRYKGVHALKNCLEYVADKRNSEELERMRRAAYGLVNEVYTVERSAKEVESYYKELTGREK